jgi:RHS repeat-associated protein
MFNLRLVSGLLIRNRRAGSALFLLASTLGQAAIPASAAQRPKDDDIFKLTASQFSEPFLATGPTTPREDEALSRTVERYRSRQVEDDFGSLTGYLADFPRSGWRVAILTNLGLSYYHDGYFAEAINALEQAWQAGRYVQEPHAKPLVDRAIGELMRMHARLGHADRLEALLKELGNRSVSGPATEAVTGAREGLWMMRHDPGTAYLCGPMALRNLLIAQGARPEQLRFLENYRSGPQGVSLQQVAELASDARLPYRLVFRGHGQKIPVPSIVHWKVSHFAAIVEERDNRFHIQDPTFGQDLWISHAALEAEASGYFLIADTGRSAGWRQVSKTEASRVRGMGFTTSQQYGANTPTEVTAHGNCGSHGLCAYDITMMTVGVRLLDTPVGYTPPKGPDAHVMLFYNQREDSQPATFGWFNVSPKWTLSSLSYIEDDPRTAGSSVMRYVAGGGSVAYLGYTASTGTFSPETRDAAVLVQTSAAPVAYERRLQDGSREVYSQSNGATSYPRRVFLTQMIDRFGNAATLSYDSQLRLTAVTDATGRQTTFSYELASPNTLLVTKITDPFGRSASLAYDALGRLSQITDVLGLQSQFTYDDGGMVNALTTPYGTSSFSYGLDGNNTRFVNATDPLGQTERVEFTHESNIYFYGNDPPNTVPQGLNLCNCFLEYRNSFYWDKHAYALSAGDYTKARLTHFHHWLFNTSETARSVESIKMPFENRVWFTYPGQADGSDYSGTYDRPTAIARVLDDGTSQITQLTYNAQGNVTDTIDPVGRETQFVYAANGVDLLQVQQKTSAAALSTLAAFTYNSQHLPLITTDAAGQTGTYVYNGAGQPTQLTDALGQVTTYQYDGLGYLTSIVNANGQTAASFIYDQASRVATRTDSEGYTVAFAYDALDRITKETFPDGTSRLYAYNNLDLASVTDRQGRVTQYSYDAVRQLVQVTDPLLRKTKFGYYENGARKTLTDPNGNTTTWNIDLESRVTSKVYADGKSAASAYETTTSRLKTLTDALGQTKQYTYAIDDQLAGIDYASAVNATASVRFAYDSYFSRITSMTDGSGATQYSYQPIGSTGALQVAQEDGPFQNDAIGYEYDALGRLATRTVDSSTETFAFDKLSRLTTQANVLGTFDFSYLGQTGQRIGQHLRNGVVGTDWAYDINTNDRRLKSIANSGATRSYQYTTTPENIISQIAETAPSGSAFSPQNWNYGYDAADRLLNGAASGGSQYGYKYDSADNITSIAGPTGIQSGAYNVDNQVTSFGGQSYVYDANGNVIDDGVRTYKWDAENRLINVVLKAQPSRITTFRYDGLGRRIAMVVNGTETRYLWCGDTLCQARTATDVVARRYFTQGEVVPASSTLLYYSQDHLGSVRDVLAVQNGSRVASFDYDPYGNTSQTAGRVSTDFRFAGMFYDQQDGLYLTNFRVYDPKAGRWLSRDPIGEDGGQNLYSYVGGNPISNFDPLGLYCTSAEGTTTCNYPNGPKFKLPTPSNFPASIGQDDLLYHNYDISRQIGCANADDVLRGLINNPTPGNPSPASTGGTPNNAVIGGTSPSLPSLDNPVTSYVTTDLNTGTSIVVNITGTNSLFSPGYVARTVSNGKAHTYGEGLNWKQSPLITGNLWLPLLGNLVQDLANQAVWGTQMSKIISQSQCGCKQ